MTAQELRQKYLKFFESKGHTIIPSASLIPENDPSVLFTTAGMHPLVPYLMGEQHPGGKRVVNVQKCIRTGDIDDVGDNRHCTFFEMIGNWSFGDYFKKEAIEWSFEFLTDKKNGLGLDPKRLYVTVFKGAEGIPRDEESIAIWKNIFEKAGTKVDVSGEDEIIKNNIKIIPLGAGDNFWIAGATGPCGVNSEMFYDTRPEEGKINGKFSDLVDSGRIIEIWNDVFMEFNKKEDGTIEKLKKHNVDTGMGIERTLAVLNGKENVFETELFKPIFDKIEKLSSKSYKQEAKSFRVIADHIKAATFIISDGVSPLNVGAGYVLRRLIRRAIRYGKQLGIPDRNASQSDAGGEKNFTAEIAKVVVEIYKDYYPELEQNKNRIFEELEKEENKFKKTLISAEKIKNKELQKIYDIIFRATAKEHGLSEKEIDEIKNKAISTEAVPLSASIAFDLETAHGYPSELFFEDLLLKTKNEKLVKESKELLKDKIEKHQELSRTASAGMFKGGLADTSEKTVQYHTVAHLMLAALRHVLGNHVMQKGSNITAERLRFDFSHPDKMTDGQKAEVEKIVNMAIEAHLDVVREEMTLD
ncbi:MAG TPA: alanine--tRNA ligase, partial [Candidatus Moranbacteria bacterium]|nr:alanine--tRNA ligase [Candidatus Moranbacteria bacterium]